MNGTASDTIAAIILITIVASESGDRGPRNKSLQKGVRRAVNLQKGDGEEKSLVYPSVRYERIGYSYIGLH